MVRRAAALISPGFRKRKIPRDLLLDPPRPKRRRWLWLLLASLCLAGVLFAIDAAAAEEAGTGRLMFEDRRPALHLETSVSIDISGHVARTELRQRFTNQTGEWQEAVYVFPLPDQAAVNFMEMRIGERIITAQVEERTRARARYEKARAEGKQAALTEQERPNLFTQSVANIAPGETIEILLRYLDIARYRDGSFTLRVPLTITPRYVPGSNLQEPRVPDAHRITPPISSGASDSHRTRISASLTPGYKVESITSDYHDIRRIRDGERYRVALSTPDVPMNRDFVLRWQPATGAVPTAVFYSEHIDGADYGLLMVLPPTRATSRRLPRDLIFVIDTSGSMKGVSMRQARSALKRALEVTLGPDDRFNIIEFDSDYSMLFSESQPVTAWSLERAARFVSGLRAGGGTEMARPLRAALGSQSDASLLKHVIFITDGAVGNEAELLRLVEDNLGDGRLFTVGIGSAPNSFFMRKAAQFGGGTFTFIGDILEVGEQIETLFEKLERPRARDVEVDWLGNSPPDAYPRKIPALYDSEPVIISARSEHIATGVRVSAMLGDEPWETSVPVVRVPSGAGIGALWARRKIETLEDALVSGADANAVRDQIIDVALAHQLVSRFTSLVAIESFVSRRPGEALANTAVPARLAKGQVIQMPRTSTHADLALLVGLLAIGGAAFCWRVGRRG